jgi:hypothetical protein
MRECITRYYSAITRYYSVSLRNELVADRHTGRYKCGMADRKPQYVPPPDMDRCVVVGGVLVALSVIGLTGFVVARLSGATPGALMAFAAVLTAVPPIIKALRGR